MLFPHTRSRRLELRPASTDDQVEFVRALLRTGVESVTPSASKVRASLKSSASFLVALRESGDVIGFTTLHGLDPAGHLRSGTYLDPARARLGVGSECIYLTINYAFAMFPIDRLLAETTEAAFGSFGVNPKQDPGIGVFQDYLYFRGRHWNLHSFAMTREEWETHVDSGLDHTLASGLSWRKHPTGALRKAS